MVTAIAPGRLTLEEFLYEAARRRVSRGSLADLEALARRLALPARLLDSHIRFDPAGYVRSLVCRSAELDLLVLCWSPGQASTVHDHGPSRGVVRVQRGVLTSRTFTARLALEREDAAGAGAIAGVDVGAIHQLANTSDEPLVTVHCYSPPLDSMGVFGPGGRRTSVRPAAP